LLRNVYDKGEIISPKLTRKMKLLLLGYTLVVSKKKKSPDLRDGVTRIELPKTDVS
jgi:hypothetical protein